MSRIRTVKPELFRHEVLFDAELESGLPLRLAFIGLFTVADCEGRFPWKPRTLKLDVLPHDIVDFAAVLAALERAGFIRRYEVNGQIYGVIPSFTKHQQITGRESERGSSLPPPPDFQNQVSEHAPSSTEPVPELTQSSTGTDPVIQEGEREREREREEEGSKDARPRTTPAPASKSPCPADLAITPELQTWATEHDYHEDLQQHLDYFRDKANAKGYQYANWQSALRNAIRDDWAGLRNPPPVTKTAAARGGDRVYQRKAADPTTPAGAEFAEILRGLSRPVIEGEVAHADC